MKVMLILASMLAAVFPIRAAETLQIKLQPERDRFLKAANAEVVFRVDLTGAESNSDRHSPINLAVVLDRSGSMEGAKLEKARQAACMAIDQLGAKDTFSLVAYDDLVNVLVPAQPVEDTERLKQEVRQIQSGGSTALYAGVESGAEQLQKYFSDRNINRIILLSDGLANVGPSSPSDLARLGKQLRSRGMNVSTVGLGDDYNENLMVALAEASNANYYYVKDTETLPKIFKDELGQIKNIIARNLRIIIEVPDGVEPIEIIGYPEIRFKDRKAEISVGEYYGSQKRNYLVRCRVPEPKSDALEVSRVHLVYVDEKLGKEANESVNARVQFTADRKDSDESMNKDVALSSALATNAAVRDRALSLQDSGKFKEAAKLLNEQSANARAQAPLLQSDKLAKEADVLQGAADQLNSGSSFGNGQRKAFQYENYNQKYQKR